MCRFSPLNAAFSRVSVSGGMKLYTLGGDSFSELTRARFVRCLAEPAFGHI